MTFNELNLSAPLLRAVAEAGYESPSPIQASAIPPVLAGRDLMGCAQTGTGKTAAFALPMLDRLTAAPAKKKGAVRALILTPTRELALQIGESFELYGKYLNQRSTVIFGGVGQAPQVAALKKGVDILIACPGRLNDLVGQGLIDLSHIEIFVLDEADRMLDMGFVHDVKKVIAKLPAQRQNLMFSATMPKEIEQLAAGILHDPAFVKVDPVSSTVDRIDQSLYFVEKGNKKFLLPWLIQNLKPPVQNALVFSRTKHGADKIAKDLNKQGIPAAAIHGNKSQSARVAALEGFKAGNTKVLVATDIAARGIDISELSHVFNYDLPEVPETYVHRIGRTARAGADGTAVSFCAPEEQEYLAGIEKLNRRKIPVVSGHPWDGVPAPAKKEPPVRGKKPKAEAEAPAAQPEKPAKAAKPARPKKEKTAAAKAEPMKSQPKEEPSMDENQKRTPGGRSENRRSNNSRPRREGSNAAPNRGSNAQPKFDPHFVSAPEATPLRSAKKNAATPAVPAQTIPTAMQNRQPAQRSENNGRNGAGRSLRNERNDRSARPAQPAQQNSQRNENRSGRSNNRNEQSSAGRVPRAPKAEQSGRNNRSRSNNVPTKDEDPGLVLISRRPPQQKFTSFEEYMNAHGGATAPIEDHSEEV
jgi:ATP-dependent RNA helicase RhlE